MKKVLDDAMNGISLLAALQHKRYHGGHALTEERFHDIVEWFVAKN